MKDSEPLNSKLEIGSAIGSLIVPAAGVVNQLAECLKPVVAGDEFEAGFEPDKG